MKRKRNFKHPGFTIVELLVVIVVIGILAAITIVSYTNISNKAIVASLQTDLSGAARQFKLYTVDFGSYPTGTGASGLTETSAGSGVWCPNAPTVDTKYCLKLSGGNQFVSYDGTATSFRLVIKNGTNFYVITEGSNPVALTAPILINPTSASITSSGATIGATISSDGGAPPITESGTCWGTSANPTTNCTPNVPGALTAIGSIATGTAPYQITISSDGKSAYVGNMTSLNISMYSRDTSSGALTALATPTITSGPNPPYGVAVSPDGTSFYAVNYVLSGATVYMYNRNTSTGTLTALASPTIAASFRAHDIAMSPDGKHVYVTNYSGDSVGMYSRNSVTSALSLLSPSTISTGSVPSGITISPDGLYVYVANALGGSISMFSRNVSSGLLTALSPATIPAGTQPYYIAISPDGKSLYAANLMSNNISMYNRDNATGLLTAMTTPTIATGTNPYSIVLSPDGLSVYTPSQANNTVSMFSRDATTGILTAMAVPTVATDTKPFGMTTSPDGLFIYVTNRDSNTIKIYSRMTGFSIGVPFIQTRAGMPSGTLIHYRGYAINSIGTGYAPDATFTTL